MLGKKRAGRVRRLAMAAMSTLLVGGIGLISSPAHGLIDLGITNPTTGLPAWFEDEHGLSLQGCSGAFCGVAAPPEVPYFRAVARIPLAQGRLDADLGLFGTYTGAVADPATAFSFSRIRLKGQGLAPATTYTITHPYGTATVTTAANGTFLSDSRFGCAAPPCDFASVVAASPLKPFLTWDPTVSAPPAGFIGDGVTAHTVIGSPTGNNIFEVRGANVGGTGVNVLTTNLFTVIGQLATGPFRLPGAPATMTGLSGPAAGVASLSWTAPALDGGSPVTSYNVYGALDPANLVLLGTVPAGGPLQLADSGRANGTLVHYAVTAVNAVGESARTLVDVTTPSTPTAPLSLGALAGPGVGQIGLSWLAPSSPGSNAVSTYRVYAGPDLAHLTALADVNPANTRWVDSGRGEGVTVHYAVSAINAIGESPMSAEAFATSFARPGAVNTFRALPASLLNVGRTSLSWQAPATDGGTRITGYRIFRSDSMHPQTLVATAAATARSWTDSSLLPLIAYKYQITAVNMVGEGARSSACTHASPWVDALAPLFPCV